MVMWFGFTHHTMWRNNVGLVCLTEKTNVFCQCIFNCLIKICIAEISIMNQNDANKIMINFHEQTILFT